MKDPYDVLGVARNTDPATIKRSYRLRAAEHHPDRNGGDNSRMQEVNEAYAILGDPERRAHYDKHGHATPQEQELRKGVQDCLLQIFTQALAADKDPVAFARANLAHAMGAVAQQREAAIAAQRKLRAKRAKVRTKGGATNLVHGLIDQQLAAQRQTQVNAEFTLKVVSRAQRELAAYEEDAPEPVFKPMQMMGTWSPMGGSF